MNYAKEHNARGPDKTSFAEINEKSGITISYGFHRLAIQGSIESVDSEKSDFIEDHRYLLLCNGEVYPPDSLCHKYKPHETHGQSDCEWILDEYHDNRIHGIRSLLEYSEFALIIYDKLTGEIVIGRDSYGIRPLYKIEFCELDDSINIPSVILCSELKYLPWNDILSDGKIKIISVEQVTPNVITSIDHMTNQYIFRTYVHEKPRTMLTNDNVHTSLHDALKIAVAERFMYADVPVGFFLSGGMDSSAICALAQKYFIGKGQKIRTFAIGMSENATDVIAAKQAAEFIGTDHTTIIVSPQDFLDAVPKVIRIQETWDVTTIRAGTGMFLIAKWVRENTDIKVVITGEGSDELFGSYRYFIKAPNPKEHRNEAERLLKDLHYYDVLRCDRTISNNSLEARVPFLDSRVIDVVVQQFADTDFNPKNNLLKPILREMCEKYELLPTSITQRVKEAFSDGVSEATQTESWHKQLQRMANNMYSNEELADNIYEHCKPVTKEELYIRDIYNKYYPTLDKLIPYKWLPKWCGDQVDPSARELNL